MSNEQRVRELWRRVWSEGDGDYAGEFFAPHYRENDTERTATGHAEGAVAFRAHFTDFRVEVVGLVALGDVVVSRVVFRGSYQGGLPGLTDIGGPIEITGLDVFHFRDGLVTEHWHEADHELMWEQLGVKLPPD